MSPFMTVVTIMVTFGAAALVAAAAALLRRSGRMRDPLYLVLLEALYRVDPAAAEQKLSHDNRMAMRCTKLAAVLSMTLIIAGVILASIGYSNHWTLPAFWRLPHGR